MESARRTALLLAATAVLALGGCNSSQQEPQAALERFFGSALRQDYATTYDCYYQRYKEKVNQEDFVKHRMEASVLKSFRIESVAQHGDQAQAVAMLTFAPSEKLHRSEPATVKVNEELVREQGQWKIKVW